MADLVDIQIDNSTFTRSDWFGFWVMIGFFALWGAGGIGLIGFAIWGPVLNGALPKDHLMRGLLLSTLALPAFLALCYALVRNSITSGAKLSFRLDRDRRVLIVHVRPIVGAAWQRKVRLWADTVVVALERENEDANWIRVEASPKGRPSVVTKIADFRLSQKTAAAHLVRRLNAELQSSQIDPDLVALLDLDPYPSP